jgi:8-oxo-dGTP diphosphatase
MKGHVAAPTACRRNPRGLPGPPGDAGDKRAWSGDDALRSLSAAGHRQAAGLLVRLRAEPVARIVSSPALRCQQTVWPLAAQRRLRVDLDPRLDVDATADQAAAPLLAPALDDAVLCTNGELIGQLLGPDRSR